MEEISVNGETYAKASSLARELGYTSDYVGQLCRGKQIQAKLIGRTWYVNEASLRSHKESRYRSTARKSRNEVKKAVNQLNSAESGPNYLKRLNLGSFYETDEAPLYPSLHKNSQTEKTSEIKPFRIKIDRQSDTRQTLEPGSAADRRTKFEVKPTADTGHRVTVISARSNKLDGNKGINIDNSRLSGAHSSLKFKLAIGLMLVVAGSLLFANFFLESRILATGEGSKEAVNFNVNFVKETFFKGF